MGKLDHNYNMLQRKRKSTDSLSIDYRDSVCIKSSLKRKKNTPSSKILYGSLWHRWSFMSWKNLEWCLFVESWKKINNKKLPITSKLTKRKLRVQCNIVWEMSLPCLRTAHRVESLSNWPSPAFIKLDQLKPNINSEHAELFERLQKIYMRCNHILNRILD